MKTEFGIMPETWVYNLCCKFNRFTHFSIPTCRLVVCMSCMYLLSMGRPCNWPEQIWVVWKIQQLINYTILINNCSSPNRGGVAFVLTNQHDAVLCVPIFYFLPVYPNQTPLVIGSVVHLTNLSATCNHQSAPLASSSGGVGNWTETGRSCGRGATYFTQSPQISVYRCPDQQLIFKSENMCDRAYI